MTRYPKVYLGLLLTYASKGEAFPTRSLMQQALDGLRHYL